MLENTNAHQNHETEMGVGGHPDEILSLIDHIEGKYGQNRLADEKAKEKLMNGVISRSLSKSKYSPLRGLIENQPGFHSDLPQDVACLFDRISNGSGYHQRTGRYYFNDRYSCKGKRPACSDWGTISPADNFRWRFNQDRWNQRGRSNSKKGIGILSLTNE